MRGLEATIGDKIVDTLSANEVTSEKKQPIALSYSLHLKLGCSLFLTGSSNSDTTLHGGVREGRENFIFLFWSHGKISGRSFKATCLN